MKKLPLLFTLALATVTVTGCDAFSFINGGTTPEPEGGEVTPSDSGGGKKEDDPEEIFIDNILLDSYSETLEIGDTYQIDYEVSPRGAYNEVSFDSSNTSVATVSVYGLVEAKAEGNSVITLTSIQDTSVTAEVSITVNPAPISNYTVAFNANGGTGSMESDTTTGSTYLTPECEFIRTNYTFDGWALNSPTATPKYGVGATISDISANITLFATWRENSTPQTNYTVTFNANGGSGSMASATTTGSTYFTPACTFTYAGHTFSKWAVNSPSGTKYDAESTICDINANITLYAIWETVVTNYTVSFNANGGSGTMANKTTTGSTFSAPACTFTYSGKSFKEWALNSTSGTKYEVGATITGISADITLYAIWQESSSDYYAACEGLTGSALQSKLKSINPAKNPSYDWSRYEAADEAEDDSTCILSIYTRHNIKKNSHCGSYAWDKWNREHVWTQSKFPASDKDNHNIFACEGQINNYRGNLIFDEGGTVVTVFGHTTGCKMVSGTSFEPCDEAKGEIARSVMYGTVMYSYTMTQEIKSIELALKWHLQHPITTRETTRNETVYGLQGNRNMFVDHPEYACKIWGNTNSATRSLCGM